LKIRELVKHSGVSKETVHYYIREGLLPKPRKQGKNIAEYDDRYVERIRLIKQLQDHYFLPIAVIKNILKNQKKSPEVQSFLDLRKEYFRPVDQFLPNEIFGEESFMDATGLRRKWLLKMEEWKIITPENRNTQKVYSQDDITLGKLIVEMGNIGLGVRDGFDPEVLKHYRDKFREIVVMSHKNYVETTIGRLPPEEFSKRIIQGREIMSVFFYHLYRKLAREINRRILDLLESEAKEGENHFEKSSTFMMDDGTLFSSASERTNKKYEISDGKIP
jgi:DNA-binding transcriptional MerR regulator